jgi:hypothetical protein
MASKKKHKPHFDLPEELDQAPKAGWVYRSAAASMESTATAKPANVMPPPAAGKSDPISEPYQMVSAGAELVGYSLGAVGQMFLLGTRVIALPVRVAERFLRGR